MVRDAQRHESRHFRRGPDGWGWTGDTTTAEATTEAEAEAAPDLDTLKKDELVALADERGVDSSGTKADLIARLGV